MGRKSSSAKGRRQMAESRKLMDTSSPGAHFQGWSGMHPEVVRVLGKDSRSPFVDPRVQVDDRAAKCGAVRPPGNTNLTAYPLRMGKNRSFDELVAGSRGELPMRTVVWHAHFGLGNSVRGFVATFIYALLSGRQMLTSQGGHDGRAFEAVAAGFEFGLDRTDLRVPHVPPVRFRKDDSPLDPSPVMHSNPFSGTFDTYWFAPQERKQCVMQAFQCTTLWCVHSRGVYSLFGQPKPSLGRAVAAVARIAPFDPKLGGSRVPQHLSLLSTVIGQQSEKLSVGGAAKTGTAGRDVPAFADAGTVPEAELAKAGLRMQFDVALHFRSAHLCVEKDGGLPVCFSNGMQGSINVLKRFPDLHKMVSVERWSCIAQLLGFLLQTKIKRQQQLREKYQGLFRDKADGRDLLGFLDPKHHRKPFRPTQVYSKTRLSKEGAQLRDWGLWTVEDSREAARQAWHAAGMASSTERTSPLTMYVAVDVEALRPLYVELLRPFGTVVYSSARIVHLVHQKASEETLLGNLAEFYLLSRSSVLLGYCKTDGQLCAQSSYALAAAHYGNATAIWGQDRAVCQFDVDHVASPLGH